jgi:sodium-type flagellar protein MotY
MANNRGWNKRITAGVIATGFISSFGFAQVTHLDFLSPMGEEKWRMSGNPLRCGLSLAIPNYGTGYFEQYATKNLHFILRTWDKVQRSLPAVVLASPPVWKTGRDYVVTKSFIKPGKYGLYLSRPPALKLLSFLSQGYEANFNYRNEQGFTTTIILSPIRFQKAYAQYQRCVSNLLSFDYNDIKESTFHFSSDSSMINDEDKIQLRRIAQYVAADKQVDVVRIVGYADDSGRKGYNNAISQFRAEAIKNYLLSLGVSIKKISVTWVGALQPIARNDTDDGRAANRRAIIRVFKK